MLGLFFQSLSSSLLIKGNKDTKAQADFFIKVVKKLLPQIKEGRQVLKEVCINPVFVDQVKRTLAGKEGQKVAFNPAQGLGKFLAGQIYLILPFKDPAPLDQV